MTGSSYAGYSGSGVGGPGQIGRRELLALISMLMALMALAIDLMLPAFDDIREAFGLDESSGKAGQVITAFFFGLAIAQVVYGPLTDRFGRKPILYLGIGIYIVAAAGSALAPTFELLLLSRFVWGIGAAGSRVVAIAIIRDMFEGQRMAKAMSQIMAIFVLAPVFAPLVGATIISVVPWQGVFWFCVIWGVLIAAWSTRLPETLAPGDRQPLDWSTTSSAIRRVMTTPVTAGYTMATVFYQAVFVAYLSNSEVIINDILGRGDQFPIVFGAVAIFFGVGALANGRLVDHYNIRQIIQVASLIYVTLAILLLVVTLAADGTPNFWLFIPILGANLSTTMFLMPNMNTAALGPVGDIAGTASSVTGSVRTFLGAGLAVAVDTQMSPTSATPFAIGIAALAVCSAIVAARTARREKLMAND